MHDKSDTCLMGLLIETFYGKYSGKKVYQSIYLVCHQCLFYSSRRDR